MRKLPLIAAMALLVVAGWFSTAQAETVLCPSSLGPGIDRQFSLTTTPAATCFDYGSGNESVPSGYVLLSKVEDSGTEGPFPASLTVDSVGQAAGTFTFTPPVGYTSFLLVLKDGNNDFPAWASFLLNGATGGSWAISDEQALSHMSVYGVASPVPLPAALPLLLAALAAIGLLGWRRTRTT
jgi:hypothetical protein